MGNAYSHTKINNSYATGSVTGSGLRVGGLAGQAYSGTTISNSYATGEVTGSGDYVGGLVGQAYENNTISNSYATGSVTGPEDVGGLVGYAYETTISSSYWDKVTTGQSTSAGGGEGKLTDDMKLKGSYGGWNFSSVWEMNEGTSYPTLR